MDLERVFTEFKRGVEKAISVDDAQTRLDLAIAYAEMGLMHDAVREAAHAFSERAPDTVARHAAEWLFAPRRCARGTLTSLLASLRHRGRG
jgi:hypothetical protein